MNASGRQTHIAAASNIAAAPNDAAPNIAADPSNAAPHANPLNNALVQAADDADP